MKTSTASLLSHGLVVILLFSCKGDEAANNTEPFSARAQAYIDQYSQQYKSLVTTANEASWLLNTRIVEGDTTTQKNYESAAQQLTDFTGSLANIDSAKKYLATPDQLSPLQKKASRDDTLLCRRQSCHRG